MRTSDSHTVKLENTRLVLEQLVRVKETSRVELARLTTLTKATVSSIVGDLVSKEFVKETNRFVKTSGRSAKIIKLNGDAARTICIEIQPESIYGIVSNLTGEVLFEDNMPIYSTQVDLFLADLLAFIDKLRAETHQSTYGLIGIGIAIYGIVQNNEKIKYATFTSWKDIDLKTIIENYTGVATFIENEANIAAYGESINHPDHSNLVLLNIGLGVGMGIVINNKLYSGETGFAGELGHTIIVPNGRKCVCGNQGCLETYISDKGVLQSYFELTKQPVDMEEFLILYKNHDYAAETVYKDFVQNLLYTVNNVSHIFNPKSIIINNKIVDFVPETISLVKNGLRSQVLSLDFLGTSKYKSKAIVIGLAHHLVKRYLKLDNYRLNNS